MIEQFGIWLAAPERGRRVASTTIQEYQRQVQGFATWLDQQLGLPLTAETVTAYRLEHYLLYLHTVRHLAPATQAMAQIDRLSAELKELRQEQAKAASDFEQRQQQTTDRLERFPIPFNRKPL